MKSQKDKALAIGEPQVTSLDEHLVNLPEDILRHLEAQYEGMYYGETNEDARELASRYFDGILCKMKLPPTVTTCRINQLKTNRDQFLREMEEVLESCGDGNGNLAEVQQQRKQRQLFHALKHPLFHDVVEIRIDEALSDAIPLSKYHAPPSCAATGPMQELFAGSSLNLRIKQKWPLHHKVIICDIFCGEAVLRGSNIFVKGVLAADRGIVAEDQVAVYANIESRTKDVPRGMVVEYYSGRCVFLGLGRAKCSRSEMFSCDNGVAVEMCNGSVESESNHGKFLMKAVTPLPPLNGKLGGKMILQNLPSILVSHALDPKPQETICDMCAAPGGKTSHIASLIGNDGLVVAMDVSRKKVHTMNSLFEIMGASCIIPIALDSTKCVLRSDPEGKNDHSVADIIRNAPRSSEDGLLDIKGFYPQSFDRILLDPPCTALGLRPKLRVPFKNLKQLEKYANYARKFASSAVALLKEGGTMTYSTCTINASENEMMVRFILDEHPRMKLVPIEFDIGRPGLPRRGLSDEERGMVRRFDPCDEGDTMGFFVAKFVKA